jgi:hypothetical protein
MPTVAQITLVFTAFQARTLITTPLLPPTSQNTPSTPLPRFPSSAPALSFLLLNQFFSELETEAKVTLILLIKLIIGEADVGEHLAGWMRVARDGDHGWVRLPSLYLISRASAYW